MSDEEKKGAETATQQAPEGSAKAKATDDSKRPQALKHNANAFCRPGDLIGPGVTRVSDFDEEHCVEAGQRVLEAATKGGVRIKDLDRVAHDWLRHLNIRGARALKLGDKEAQTEFEALCEELASKKAPFQVAAQQAAEEEKKARQAMKEVNDRKRSARSG